MKPDVVERTVVLIKPDGVKRGIVGRVLTRFEEVGLKIAALKLVQVIDHNLRNGTQHYYDTQGRLLRTLDEVINAMLTDSLALSKPAENTKEIEAGEWVRVGELVA